MSTSEHRPENLPHFRRRSPSNSLEELLADSLDQIFTFSSRWLKEFGQNISNHLQEVQTQSSLELRPDDENFHHQVGIQEG
jgi:hypothetical protein